MATGNTGKNLYLLFAAGTLATSQHAFSSSEEIGVVDQTSGADANRTYLDTVLDGTAKATFKHAAGGTTIWGYLIPGTEGTLEWGPEGTVAGKPRHYANAICVNRSMSEGYQDLIVIDASWQLSGAVTDGTY